MFHVEAPPWTPPTSGDATITPGTDPPHLHLPPAGSRTPAEPPAGGRESPSLFDTWSRKAKIRGSFTLPILRDDSPSSERASRLQQEKQILMEEVKAQKVTHHCDRGQRCLVF